MKNYIEKGEEICAYQTKTYEDLSHKFFIEVKIYQQKKSYMNWFVSSAP